MPGDLKDSGLTIEDPANKWEYIIVNIGEKGERKVLTHIIGIGKAIKVRKAMFSRACGWINLKIELF